jgi:hypothetical protein
MAGISERNVQKQELVSAGYSLKYIDEWQPKTTLYRHKTSLNAEGELAYEVGTAITGVPGSPDYVLRKSKIGMFPWMPGDGCSCRWCNVKNPEAPQEEPEQEEEDQEATRTKRRMGPHFQSDS